MENKIKGPFVFVHCEKQDGKESASFYILTKTEFIALVNSTDDAYFYGPHKKGPIKEDYPIALSLKKDLYPFRDHWDSLWEE